MKEPSGLDGLTAAERRASRERLLVLGGEPEAVARIEKRWIAGAAGTLRVWSYTPLGAPMGLLPGLIYFHGGFAEGSLEAYDGICRSLANASGCRVAAVDHRLGPQAPFPAALRDACAATRGIAEDAARFGIDARRIGVCGDSTGAALAAAVAQACAAGKGPPLALQFLLCPILEHGPEIPAAPDEQPPEGLAAALIHTAEGDPLSGQAAAYAARLERAGVRVTRRCHAGLTYLFDGIKAAIPCTAGAFRLMGGDIRAFL